MATASFPRLEEIKKLTTDIGFARIVDTVPGNDLSRERLESSWPKIPKRFISYAIAIHEF